MYTMTSTVHMFRFSLDICAGMVHVSSLYRRTRATQDYPYVCVWGATGSWTSGKHVIILVARVGRSFPLADFLDRIESISI